MEKWGFLRECCDMANGTDSATGLHRTGFEEYAEVIFPDVSDWIHDRIIPDSGKRFRPDWRSESLKLIVEFDGVQHYQSPKEILRDTERTEFYQGLGYKVVRIPFFIQLSNYAVDKMFGRKVAEPLFNETLYPSMNVGDKCTPAFMCPAGIERMAKELIEFPEQCRVNLEHLEKERNEFLTGVSILKKKIEELQISRKVN